MKKILNWELGVIEAWVLVCGGLHIIGKLDWTWFQILLPLTVWYGGKLLTYISMGVFYTGVEVQKAKKEKEKSDHDKLVGVSSFPGGVN